MRVRELRAEERPYTWEVQSFDGFEWRTKEFTAQLFWNWFAPRTARIYQNVSLPPRTRAV